MILKENVLRAIDTPRNRILIALEMNLTENSIRQYIHRNDEKLTQYAPLQMIKKIMGVNDEAELLTEKVFAAE
jgi:hypothetical protein